MSFSSSLLDSTWLKLCEDKNDIEPNVLFQTTVPPTARSKIPGENLYYNTKYGDNIFVQLSSLPDNKTYVATTDQAIPLLIDPETLKQQGMLKWDDKLSC